MDSSPVSIVDEALPVIKKTARDVMCDYPLPPRFGLEVNDFVSWGVIGVSRRAAEKPRCGEDFRRWARSVARSEMCNELRKLYTRSRAYSEGDADESMDGMADRAFFDRRELSPLAVAATKELLSRFTARLTDLQRDTLVKVVLEGWCASDIAKVRGVDRNAVYQSYRAATRKVGRAMALDGMAGGVVWERDFMPARLESPHESRRGIGERPVVDDLGNNYPSVSHAAGAMGLKCPSSITNAIRTGGMSRGRRWSHAPEAA